MTSLSSNNIKIHNINFLKCL